MKKIHSADELWPWLDQLGDQQSFYLLEHFVPGTVYHVDSIASEREVVFAEAHTYGTPPLTTSHQGGSIHYQHSAGRFDGNRGAAGHEQKSIERAGICSWRDARGIPEGR